MESIYAAHSTLGADIQLHPVGAEGKYGSFSYLSFPYYWSHGFLLLSNSHGNRMIPRRAR
jgi:hypothetical protein